jgi:catechol 2,3-dioxygenase-like lactoylglutathione lyase family enzyme
MIDHLNLPVRDVRRSTAFYLSVLAPLGYALVRDFGDDAAGLGTLDHALLGLERVTGPIRPLHVAFTAPDRATVDACYRAAIAAGAQDNGPPGPRPHYHAHYFAGFFVDPDGHNIEVVCHVAHGQE